MPRFLIRNIASVSAFTDLILSFLPSSLRQFIRNIYYENKLSGSRMDSEADLEILKEIIHELHLVVDAGANYGLYTRFMSQYAGSNGRVFSFEPVSASYLTLLHNVRKLKLGNVSVYRIALSDHNRKAFMEIPFYSEGGVNHYEAHLVESNIPGKSEEVSAMPLDEVLGNLRPDFIKIDVEGHEKQLLKGALKIITASRPVMLIEINGGIRNSNQRAVDVRSITDALGYRIYKSDGHRLRAVNGDDEGFNYFFLCEEHENKLARLISR